MTKTFAERMKSQGGYLKDTDLKDATKELGEDFRVVVKKFMGVREMTPLKDLAKVEKRIVEEGDSVKSVFIAADVFFKLYGED